MIRTLVFAASLVVLAAGVAAQDAEPASTRTVEASKPGPTNFSAPIRLEDGNGFIHTEAPGYASPCWADVDGDGNKDLLVGQFAGGKIKVHRGLGNGRIGTGEWLEAGGKVAEVPGVW